jgi:class 3 adenylate cyclase
MNKDIDVRHVLPAVRVPTLVLHRIGDQLTRVEQGRYLAEHIAGARLVELPGSDHAPWVGDGEAILAETEEFLTGVRHQPEADRVLATVLFVDIVGSTEKAAALGDRRWGEVLEQYYALSRQALGRHRGREVDTAGDGLFATFDGPARAIRCASDIAAAVRSLGLEVRAGLHTGECEVIGPKVGGIAVHIGARVAAQAEPGEVLVSSTVKDLVAGSNLRFAERGPRTLKGVPGEWRLFAAVPG